MFVTNHAERVQETLACIMPVKAGDSITFSSTGTDSSIARRFYK